MEKRHLQTLSEDEEGWESMKLPRLSNPTVVYKDENTEITTSSLFDHMTTNQQWGVLVFAVLLLIALLVCLFLQSKGILK